MAPEVVEEPSPPQDTSTDAEKKFADLQAKTERNTVILAGQFSEVSQSLSAQKRNLLMALRKKLPPEQKTPDQKEEEDAKPAVPVATPCIGAPLIDRNCIRSMNPSFYGRQAI